MAVILKLIFFILFCISVHGQITLDKDEKIKVIGISGTPQSGTTSLSSVLKVKLNCPVIK